MSPGDREGHARRPEAATEDDPQLAVVIPALNEATTLPALLESLHRQKGVRLQVIVADGGSRDGTLESCLRAARRIGLSLEAIQTPAGRARQMNEGARAGSAQELLFLHADSILEEADLLVRTRDHMSAERARRGTDRIAGHFGVRFIRSEPRSSGAYYFYESKSRLNRPDCVNGDQGFWLSRRYFEELGGFDESMPYFEDARLAAQVFTTGAWITLPGRVSTSARRFEVEGLRERQTLNALLCNFESIGLEGFFGAAADAYRVQENTGRLRVGAFLRVAHRVSLAGGVRPALGHWYRTGGYVAHNAWQLAFALDCARNRRAGHPPGDGPSPWLDRFDRWGRPLFASGAIQTATAVLTAFWFYGSLALSRR